MSQPDPAAKAPWGCRSLGCVVGLAFFLFLMMAGIGIGLIELAWTLLFGWAGFLSRVIPKISWDWASIITGVLFAGVVGILAHLFLAWVTNGIAAARAVSFQWQWKWTVCGLLLCAFCMLVGMSVAGAAHQIGWILGSKESLYEDRYAMHRYVEVREMELTIKEALLDAHTLPELRKNVPALLKGPQESRRSSSLESVRLLASLGPSNTVVGVIVLPMDKKFERKYGAIYVTPNGSGPIASKDLSSFIQLNSTNLVAF